MNSALRVMIIQLFMTIMRKLKGALIYFRSHVVNKKHEKVKIPNEETLKAIKDSENNINMVKCLNVEDMFNELEI